MHPGKRQKGRETLHLKEQEIEFKRNNQFFLSLEFSFLVHSKVHPFPFHSLIRQASTVLGFLAFFC